MNITMPVNYYYSNNVNPAEYESEDELLHLCDACAAQYGAQVQFASQGDEETSCEFCATANDPARWAHFDVLSA